MRGGRLASPWIVLVAAAALGCGTHPRAAGRVELAPPVGARVALLPLDNLTGSPESSRRYTQLLYDAIAGYGNLQLASPVKVERLLAKYRVRRTHLIDSLTVRAFQEELGVRFLLLGSILDFAEPSQAPSSQAEITVTLRLLDSSSLDVVWTCSDARSGADREGPFSWGIIRTAGKLGEQSAREVAEELNSFLVH